ncbi:MAG: glutamate-ammonia-ligase adenylyltransferase [Glaciecola sp.]
MAAAAQDPDLAISLLTSAVLWPPTQDGVTWLVLEACRRVASPESALHVLCDLARDHRSSFDDLIADADWLARAVAVAGTSGPLGQLLATHTSALRSLASPAPVVAADIAQVVELAVVQAGRQSEAGSHADRERTEAQARAVATIRRHVTATIAARDLTDMAAVDEIAGDLASLAEGVLEGTLAGVHAHVGGDEPAARIAVIGMGKLGGQELNYISDVDVVYVHEATGEGSEADVAAAAESTRTLTLVMAVLNASTTMGRAYEVDPTLRPEGRNGALSRTLEGFESYWDRWAKTWEFQALLKARPVAGDRDLGERFIDSARRRVWPEELDPGVIGEIRRMKARVEAKPEVRRDGDRQVKLGPGGLRDIEFAVQLLQLVHGRHDRRLRLTGTVPALLALANGGYVGDEDASAFTDAYRMLRRVEHRLQLANERRTHTIPEGDEGNEWLARSLGYIATTQEPARAPFLRELRAVQATVRDLHAKLFYRPLLEVHAAVSAAEGQLSLPGQVVAMGPDDAHERLRALGFRDPVAALRHIGVITGGVSRQARAVRAALPAMMHRLASTADPDAGLRALRSVLEGHGSGSPLTAKLRDHPPAADFLAGVLGTGALAGDLLATQPGAAGWLSDDALATTPRERDELVRLLAARLGWQDRDAALRRIKRQELLRVVLRDLGGFADHRVVSSELTALGEACLEVGLRAVIQDVLRARGGGSAPAKMAIIGMGKLGGGELHYCSDLDVLFVHEAVEGADPADANAFALRVAGQLIRSLSAITAEGTAFEVDADLRPEGRSGTLSRTLRAYSSYYARWSDPWEHQALLRSRPVAGDTGIAERFSATIEPLAIPEILDDSMIVHLRKLKARLERERVPRRADPMRHLKMGPGGLADIEWTVQFLQLEHGARIPEVRTAGTISALARLHQAEILSTDEADVLRGAYGFFTNIRNRLYLRRENSVDELPRAGSEGTEFLARAMGYDPGDWQEFEEDHARHRRRVRSICEDRFFGMDPGEAHA